MKKFTGRTKLLRESYRNDGTIYDGPVLLVEAVHPSWIFPQVGGLDSFKVVEDTESKRRYEKMVGYTKYIVEVDK